MRKEDATHSRKSGKKLHANELWFIPVLLVDLDYLKESVENAFLVVNFTRQKRHSQPYVKK